MWVPGGVGTATGPLRSSRGGQRTSPLGVACCLPLGPFHGESQRLHLSPLLAAVFFTLACLEIRDPLIFLCFFCAPARSHGDLNRKDPWRRCISPPGDLLLNSLGVAGFCRNPRLKSSPPPSAPGGIRS